VGRIRLRPLRCLTREKAKSRRDEAWGTGSWKLFVWPEGELGGEWKFLEKVSMLVEPSK
jgi:hypothetical protein